MCPETFCCFRFDLGPLLQGQMWFFIPIMVYISLVIGRRGFGCEDKPIGNHVPQLLGGSDLTLDPSFKVECGPCNL